MIDSGSFVFVDYKKTQNYWAKHKRISGYSWITKKQTILLCGYCGVVQSTENVGNIETALAVINFYERKNNQPYVEKRKKFQRIKRRDVLQFCDFIQKKQDLASEIPEWVGADIFSFLDFKISYVRQKLIENSERRDRQQMIPIQCLTEISYEEYQKKMIV